MTRRALLLSLLCSVSLAITAAPEILIERTPDGGLQPRLLTDVDGTTHLLYFLPGEPGSRRGDYVYRHKGSEAKQWSGPVILSDGDQPLFDPIGRASIDRDETGRIHITWFVGGPRPYAYVRSNPSRTEFSSPIFPVSTNTEGIEAGAAVVVAGNTVSMIWHAGSMANETTRRVYAITSPDGGETWGDEIAIDESALGVCACCGLAATTDESGKLLVAYRSAVNNEGRHMQLLASGKSRAISEWTLTTCPVSTNAFAGSWLAFETQGEILTWNAQRQPVASTVSPATNETRQKHPAISVSPDGRRLVAWGEAAGYIKGGRLTYLLFDIDGNSVPGNTTVDIADYSSVASTWRDDHFLLLH